MKAALGLLVLTLFASVVKADSISFPSDLSKLYYPHGATITQITHIPSDGVMAPSDSINFTFSDGSGSEGGDFFDGVGGSIDFTTPANSVTLNWVSTSGLGGYLFANGGFYNLVGSSGSVTVTGDISFVNWFIDSPSNGGIDSMSFTTPEPSSLLLLTAGMMLTYLFRRRASLST